MFIKEVEKITGITGKNIRFYEQEGMLNPTRDKQNRYRNYSEDEVQILKEIKLLRKFDIPLKDIKSIQNKTLSLNECMEQNISFLCEKKNKLIKAIELCQEINKNELQLSTMNVDSYLDKIEVMEKNGVNFADIARDFITKARAYLPAKSKFFFEPDDPITTKREFTDELIKYANKKNLDLTILKESMEPIIRLDGKTYICMLEMPRTLHFPFSIFFVTKTFGFRFVYLYEVDSNLFNW